MEKLILFGVLSLPLIFISRRNLFAPASHGFYRFFSWECILWLLLSNYKFLYLTALFDEKECIAYFGNKYLDYMKRTKMFIPFLF